MADIQKLNVNNTTYDISTTWEKVTGKPSTFTPSSHTHSYLPLSGGTMTGAINLSNTNAKLAFGSLTTSPITGYKAPSLSSNGVGIYSRYGGSSDEGAIIVTEDTCVIYNSADTGWNFQVMDKDLGSDMTNDATRTFGVNQNHQAWSLSGFVKSGSSNNYVLLGGGDHKLISDFATAGHTHDNVYSKKYSYSLPPQKCVKITYDGYTPVIISACRSNGNSQFLLAGLGYGADGWTRNQFRCLIPSPSFTWKLSAIACTVELYHNATFEGAGDATVTVITTGNIIFTAADTLSGTEDTKRFACFDELTWNNITSKPTIPTNTNQLTNGAGFITGITKSMVTTALGYTPPTSDTNTWRPVTNTYTGSDQSTCVSQYGTNALYNELLNGYANSAGSASSVPWSGVTSKPSFFTPARYGTQSSHSYYKIKINSTTSWMLAFNVRVYKSYNFFDIRFSGYNYGTNYWYSPTASLTDGDSAITVYFGYDSAWNLWVAIPGGSYTGIEITNACNGYTQVIGPDLSSLFTISAVDSLSGTIQSTQTIQPPSRLGHTHTKSQITDFPSSLPASDVYSWAKASTKPTYNFGEIGPGIATIGDGANRLMFRTNASYASGMYYSTPGNEALVFANKYSVTSWIFANTDPTSQTAWSSLTPCMQIKNGKVVINKLIANDANASYNLDVNGSANATTLYENGTRVALSGHTHDDRYYTESEINTKLSSKSDTGHTHSYLPLSGGAMSSGARISASDGNLLIGNSSNAGWVGVQDMCSQASLGDGYWSIRTSGVAVFNKVSATNGFFQSSDERLKTFYEPIKPDLEKLKTLRKNYFKFNDKDKLEIGVSAQEIQSIYPEIVSMDNNGYLSVAYDKLSVIALAAIDEQQNIINEQNNKINQLEERLKAIENILSKLTS